ncbi:uncharacterized protein RSE6_06135 [Rhynchosporium secalis]|uniref:Uncharacterized protein n=1 Tax=Rhynchosporium secalis TaxID=38038 RepID=A0A1E1MAQ2_RHYSE|nr:uncharacterized protein RSE6_06135 [Rhynchosporium secalis]
MMHIGRILRALPDGTCNAGKVFYSCQVNSFRGCCSVDPCALSACPDTDASSSSMPFSKTTSQSSSRQTLASIPNSILTASAATTTTIQPTSTIGIITVTSSTPTPTQTQSPVEAQTPSSSPTAKAASTSGVSKTPIVAGTVTGVVVFSILLILLWFCVRRRKQKQTIRNSIAEYGVPTKEFVLDRSTSPGYQRGGGDVFAPFGGRYDSLRLTSATPPPKTVSAPISDPTALQGVNLIAAPTSIGSSHIEVNSNSDPSTPIIDRPLPDTEKSIVFTPPPAHEHPFFHPLPGQDVGIPTYHPSVPIDSNTSSATSTSTVPQKSTLISHPTYHISQLSTHPAFQKPASPPRAYRIPPRTSEVWEWGSLSPMQSTPTSHASYQPGAHQQQSQAQQQNQHTWRHSKQSTSTTNALTSPIPGRSELEAEVPHTYLSPTPRYEMPTRRDFDYTNNAYTDHRSQWTPISRGNTDASKYSIPIGLGVDRHTAARATSSFSASLSAPNVRQYNNDNSPETRHELESPNPALSFFLAIPTSKSSSTARHMCGPLGPNLTSPHVINCAVSNSGHTSPEAHQTAQSASDQIGAGPVPVTISPLSPPERWSGATAVQSAHTQTSGQEAIHSACQSACSGSGSPENENENVGITLCGYVQSSSLT